MFGLKWAEALEQGLVYNAVDACAKLGIDGEQLDRIWADAKDSESFGVSLSLRSVEYRWSIGGSPFSLMLSSMAPIFECKKCSPLVLVQTPCLTFST